MNTQPGHDSAAPGADPITGFLPGEQVAVAIIARDLPAGPDGSLAAEVVAGLVDGQSSGVVVLIGRSSGNLMIGIAR